VWGGVGGLLLLLDGIAVHIAVAFKKAVFDTKQSRLTLCYVVV
jgi:hypothetical protein